MAAKASRQERLYYKIGEACKLLDIQPYVLRYWETEFPALEPNKSRSGQRVYSEREIEIIRRIKELLYDEGYTIAGAKKKLEADLSGNGPAPAKKAAPSKKKSAASQLDTRAAKQVETLRSGISEALDEAKALLELLGPAS